MMRNSMVPTAVAIGLLILTSAASAPAQIQSTAQQKCLNALNKDGAAVARTQGKENVGCVKTAGKTTPTGAQACLSADAKGKVGKAQAKTSADETKLCGTPPGIGYTSAATINTAAEQGEVDLTADVFGPNLDVALFSCNPLKGFCTCQQKVQKEVEKLAALKLAEFVKCKKAVLAGGASSEAALEGCVNNASQVGSIAADTKGKIAKARTKLNTTITKSCDAGSVTTSAFGMGDCATLSNGALGTCLDVQVECRVCQIINEMDGLFVNCDLFDDGLANATCASGTGPTPTPIPTITPTPGPTATPAFAGAISRTTGLWNYDGVNGLPGGQLECNDHFPGSHVCTFDELETWEAAGQLVGIVDVDALAVNHFWAVIPTAPLLDQCKATVGTLTWFYATAHTGAAGNHAALNNGTGVLDPVQPPVSCVGNNFSVGCCY